MTKQEKADEKRRRDVARAEARGKRYALGYAARQLQANGYVMAAKELRRMARSVRVASGAR